MPEIKKTEQQPTTPKTPTRARKSGQEPPAHKKNFGLEFLISVIAHLIAPVALAAVTTAWVFFAKDPSVPPWPFLVFIVLTVFVVYLAIVSLQYFFHKDFMLPRRLNFHVALFALIIVAVTAPLALTLSFTTARINSLVERVEKVNEDRKKEQEAQKAAENRRIQLFHAVNGKMTDLLHKENINDEDLRDLLDYCIRSINLNNPRAQELRATVVYLDKSGKYLVVPPHGYYGFDQDITGLRFDLSEQKDKEPDEEYLQRIGVAGWSYLKKTSVLDDDVQSWKESEKYRYKPYSGSSKDREDRAMICVGIPDVKAGKKDQFVGVLSISSVTADVFTSNDQAVARFFATLLGKIKTPVESPAAMGDELRN